VKTTSPIPVKSFHTYNDSAFIYEPLQAWSQQQGIQFSRAGLELLRLGGQGRTCLQSKTKVPTTMSQ